MAKASQGGARSSSGRRRGPARAEATASATSARSKA